MSEFKKLTCRRLQNSAESWAKLRRPAETAVELRLPSELAFVETASSKILNDGSPFVGTDVLAYGSR